MKMFENVSMCLMTFFYLFIFLVFFFFRQYYSKFISKDQHFQNNAVVLRFEIVSDIKVSVSHQFIRP